MVLATRAHQPYRGRSTEQSERVWQEEWLLAEGGARPNLQPTTTAQQQTYTAQCATAVNLHGGLLDREKFFLGPSESVLDHPMWQRTNNAEFCIQLRHTHNENGRRIIHTQQTRPKVCAPAGTRRES